MNDPAGAATELLQRYVEAALDTLDAGAGLDLDALCRDHPELRAAVAESLAIAARLPAKSLDPDPLAGRALAGRYCLEERIGAGAMGAVYRAIDRELDRPVAVKVLHHGELQSPAAAARFAREAEALAALQHPGIVAVHDRGRTAAGLSFLVMDLVDGTSLAAVVGWLESRPPALFAPPAWLAELFDAPPEQPPSYLTLVTTWCRDLARALAAAHREGIFHRDVKPSNVMLTRQAAPVLLDFGIAARPDRGQITASQTALGTPWYMPPEAASEGHKPSPAHDVYSLGATLYHLLAGRPPVEGTAAEVLARLHSGETTPLRSARPDVPRDLAAVVEHCLEADPRRRYASAAAVAADLQAFLDHRPVTARPVPPLVRRWRSWRRRPARPLLAAAAALAVVTIVLAVALSRTRAAAAAGERLAEQQRRIASIPALLSLEGYPDHRLLEGLGEQRAALQLLDGILACGDDLPTRLLRAALRLDTGDHQGAAADLDAIDASSHSAYLSAVAACYRQADSSRRGSEAVNLATLPAPKTPVDMFVAGFHHLRSRDWQAMPAVDRMLRTAAADFPPAADLRLLTLLVLASRASDSVDKRALYQEAHDEALRLAGRHGKTARTQHVIGAACIGLGRFADAVAPLREACALRPGRHGPLHNLGLAYYHLGDLDAAEQALDEAHRLRPWLWNTMHTLARVRCAQERFDEAAAWVARIPDDPREATAWKKPYLLGHIEISRAIKALRLGDDDAARTAAAAAVDCFAAAAQAGGNPRRMASGRAYAQALAGDQRGAAVEHFLAELDDADTVNPVHVVNLATLLGDASLPEATVAAVREFLVRQATAMQPGRAVFADYLRSLHDTRGK